MPICTRLINISAYYVFVIYFADKNREIHTVNWGVFAFLISSFLKIITSIGWMKSTSKMIFPIEICSISKQSVVKIRTVGVYLFVFVCFVVPVVVAIAIILEMHCGIKNNHLNPKPAIFNSICWIIFWFSTLFWE